MVPATAIFYFPAEEIGAKKGGPGKSPEITETAKIQIQTYTFLSFSSSLQDPYVNM